MSEARNRHVEVDPDWRVPILPPAGVGVITESCDNRTELTTVPIRSGEGLRIGGEVNLCLHCGPEGSVYHPGAGHTMADVRRVADRLPFTTGFDPDDLTESVMRAYDNELRRDLGRHE